MGFHRQRTMWLWRNPDNVTYRQLLSIDQVWRRSTALTWSRWGCIRLADNIWLLAHDNIMQLSLRFNGHFPGGPGLAGTRMSPFWIILELWMMEVVVTTGAIRCAKFQSNHHHQQTDSRVFYRPDALPVAQPTVSKHWRETVFNVTALNKSLGWLVGVSRHFQHK